MTNAMFAPACTFLLVAILQYSELQAAQPSAADDAGARAAAPRAAADAQQRGIELPSDFVVPAPALGEPFRVQSRLSGAKPGFRVYRWTYPSPLVTATPANNTIPADYYLPDGIKPGDSPRPAVVCLHILNGNFELERSLCAALARRGVPAIMFKLPYYGERALPGGQAALLRDGGLFIEALPQGIQDARRTLETLAARPEIDPQRIGITGISLGGIVSAGAAGSDPRFHKAALILAGGGLWDILRTARETSAMNRHIDSLSDVQRQAIELAVQAVDPLTHAPGLRERALDGRVLMINADQDEVIPPRATTQLAAALGIEERVVWLEGLGHYTAAARLPEVMRRTVEFFAQDLPTGTTPPQALPSQAAADAHDPYATLGELLAQAGKMLVAAPGEGRCCSADVVVKLIDKNSRKHSGQLRWIRGSQGRFRLEGAVDGIGKASCGLGDYPWMASREKLFRGRVDGDAPSLKFDELLDSAHVAKLRIVASGLSTMKAAPTLLEQLVSATLERRDDGAWMLSVRPRKEKKRPALDVELRADGTTASSISLVADGYEAQISILDWQTDALASDAMFEPPAGLATQEVPSQELLRVFAAQFNFAMEQLQ